MAQRDRAPCKGDAMGQMEEIRAVDVQMDNLNGPQLCLSIWLGCFVPAATAGSGCSDLHIVKEGEEDPGSPVL